MKYIDKYLPYLIAIGVIIMLVRMFSPNEINLKPFKEGQEKLQNKVEIIEEKLDSLKNFRDTFKEKEVIIKETQKEQTNEVIKTNDIDSLIILFNTHFFAGSTSR